MKECTAQEIIDALEKQIPKKPAYEARIRCPMCNEELFSIIDGVKVAGRITSNCPNCGQALDWSDE